MPIRSFLFVPGDSEHKLAKGAASGAGCCRALLAWAGVGVHALGAGAQHANIAVVKPRLDRHLAA